MNSDAVVVASVFASCGAQMVAILLSSSPMPHPPRASQLYSAAVDSHSIHFSRNYASIDH